jgi:phosphate/phosphite/phosphonate ABC transporter binding protein
MALRIGAVAYAPYVVTIFEGIKKHFQHQRIDLDWVLYSNYDALVEAFVTREVDLAWNGPLAYVKIRRRLPEPCKVVAMRDIDVGFTTHFITQTDSPMQRLEDLAGKRFAFASQGSVQAGLLAYYYLKHGGVHPEHDLGRYTFHEQRPPTKQSDEAAVVELVASGEYDAGAVSGYMLKKLQEKGRFPEGKVRVFWSSPPYSHCCFTAQREMDNTLAQRITAAFASMNYADPAYKEVFDLEGCTAFVPGTAKGFDTLEAAAEEEGLI